LHAENFTQRREDAKKFLTRIARIFKDSIFKARRAGIFVENGIKKSQAPSGAEYAAPTGLEIFRSWFYKDVAPTALGKIVGLVKIPGHVWPIISSGNL
jgi:hypothetical protein